MIFKGRLAELLFFFPLVLLEINLAFSRIKDFEGNPLLCAAIILLFLIFTKLVHVERNQTVERIFGD